jgi:hypothetical protein
MLRLDSPGHQDVRYRLNCLVIAFAPCLGCPGAVSPDRPRATGSMQRTLTDPKGAITNRVTGPSFSLSPSSAAGLYRSGRVVCGGYLVGVEGKLHSRELPVTRTARPGALQ